MKIEKSLRELEVVALELQPPLILDSNTLVSMVIKAMRQHGLGYALLERAGRLVGIFTERDVFLSVLGNDTVLEEPVAAHMTVDPVWRVIHMMHTGGYRQVPIVDDADRILGCVRHKDLAGYLVDHYAAQVLNLPPDPEQLARAPEGG
jgi:CBS domain-containing protein